MRGIAKFSGEYNLDDSAVNPDLAAGALTDVAGNLISPRKPESFIF